MKRILFAAAAAAAVIAGSAAVAAPAMASNGQPHKVVAVTYSPLHHDTTSVTGAATQPSPGGPVWAYDDLHERFVVTPKAGPGNYSLTITVGGRFHGFADPRTAAEGSTTESPWWHPRQRGLGTGHHAVRHQFQPGPQPVGPAAGE